jgi:hypothetical protein
VHGLNGERWSTWSTEKPTDPGNVMWLNDLLPFKLPTARIMTFGYDARLFYNHSTLGIGDHGKALMTQLRDKRSKPEVRHSYT